MLFHLAFDEKSFPVEVSTVQDGALSETDALNSDADLGGELQGKYINWLATAAIADIQAESYPGPKPTSLLYKILRQSILLAYSNLAGTERMCTGKLAIAQIQKPSSSTEPHVTTLTPWQVLTRPFGPNPAITWADYLLMNNFPAGSSFIK